MRNNQQKEVDKESTGTKKSRLNQKAVALKQAQQFNPNPEADPLYEGLTEPEHQQSHQIHDLQQPPQGKALLDLLEGITEQQALECPELMREIIAKNLKAAANKYEKKPPINLIQYLNENPTSDLLFSEKPQQEFLFKNSYVPGGKVSIWPSSNGTGKTQFLVQIALQAVLNECFMHQTNGRNFFEPEKEMRVLILSFEDDRNTFISRIHNTIEHFPVLAKRKKAVLEQVAKNLEIIELPALTPDHLLTYVDNQTSKISADSMYQQVIELATERQFDLIFIDPMHYSTAANENDNNQQGQHIRFITNLAEKTKAGVFCFSHTTDSNPLRIRGATSISDRARSVFKAATLERLRASQDLICKSITKSLINSGIGEGKSYKNLIYFKMDKNSYGVEDPSPVILERHADGVLAPIACLNANKMTDETKIITYISEQQGQIASKPMIEADLTDSLSIAKSSFKNKLDSMADKGLIRKCDQIEVKAKLSNTITSKATWFGLID